MKRVCLGGGREQGAADSTDPFAALLTPKEGSSVALSKQSIRQKKKLQLSIVYHLSG